MSINLRNVSVSMPLLLLLLSIITGGSLPSGYGQNTPPNITSGDIIDLFGNVTDREEGGRGEDDDDLSNFAQLNDGGNNNDNSNDNDNSSSSSPGMPSPSPPSPSPTTSKTAVMINEIELNPPGEYDEGKEWIEL